MTAVELTTLRFAFGLPAALVIVLATGSPLWVPDVQSTVSVAGIALIPGPAGDVAVLRRAAPDRGIQSHPGRTGIPADGAPL